MVKTKKGQSAEPAADSSYVNGVPVDLPPAESKSQKWRRLASARVAKAVGVLNAIGSLSSKSSYEYSDAELAVVRDTLQNALNACLSRFSGEAARPSLFDSLPPSAT